MDRYELKQYILENYSASSDNPWISYPDYEVFRHISNKKWFAVIMNVSKAKLGMADKEDLDIVNVKCDPIMIGSFLSVPGFFRAYHMNKEKWISIALDGSVPDDTIKMLLDISYDSTSSHKKKNSTDDSEVKQ